MRPQTAVLFTLIALGLTLVARAGETHLFILSGQSNMAGLKPETSFLPELEKLLPGDEIRHVKFAKGAQPILKWVKTWNAIAKKNGLPERQGCGAFYDIVLQQTRDAIAKAEPKTVTFLWMQGERDAKFNMSSVYEASLVTLIANLRKDLNRPKMKVVIGRLSDHLTSKPWEAVREAQVKIARKDPHGAWVDTDDANDKERNGAPFNDLHYSKEGYDLFGRRLARQAARLIQDKVPDPKGRPD